MPDTHFLVDFAPPAEVLHVLRTLSLGRGLTTQQIAAEVCNNYGYQMQDDLTYSPRRLYDLGLALQTREGRRFTYRLTDLGRRLQTILAFDSALATDLLHYLHYTGSVAGAERKYLWSYRRCCQIIYAGKSVPHPSELAATIQSDMKLAFPQINQDARQGGRFNAGGVYNILVWLRALEPCPIPKNGTGLTLRQVNKPELSILALDDFYRSRKYSFGDPVLMDEGLVDEVAGVFFLDPQCCREQHRMCSRITPYVKIRDTLFGPSIVLTTHLTLETIVR